jgi:hypothetical protein
MRTVVDCRYCGHALTDGESVPLCYVCQGRTWDVYADDGTVVPCEEW